MRLAGDHERAPKLAPQSGQGRRVGTMNGVSEGDRASRGEIILYSTDDGGAQIELRAEEGAVWLTQAQIAELFATTKQNVSLHVRKILADGELTAEATVKEYLTVQTEGTRRVRRVVNVYRLDMILAVGYRVRSTRGVQFRRWATTVLREYLVKGFAMHDERLKDPNADYFDELLERIRDIRASEARFYRKVGDVLALSEDFDPASHTAIDLFARIQDKMLHAVTGYTAAELIVARSDPESPNIGLVGQRGARPGIGEAVKARNYLDDTEVREINLIMTMFLDTAERRANNRPTMRLAQWEGVLTRFLAGNGLTIPDSAGDVTAARIGEIAEYRCKVVDAERIPVTIIRRAAAMAPIAAMPSRRERMGGYA